MVIVGSIDNFLRPILMKGEGGMSTLWMFFAVLGGLSLFGLLGLIYGPLIFGLCAVLLSLYRDEFADELAKQAAR
jgi:predicted PurR-regulated permease PerM